MGVLRVVSFGASLVWLFWWIHDTSRSRGIVVPAEDSGEALEDFFSFGGIQTQLDNRRSMIVRRTTIGRAVGIFGARKRRRSHPSSGSHITTTCRSASTLTL